MQYDRGDIDSLQPGNCSSHAGNDNQRILNSHAQQQKQQQYRIVEILQNETTRLVGVHVRAALALNRNQCDDDGTSPLFLLATVNNLGHVHQVLEQKERSEQCYQRLLQYLFLFRDQQLLQGSDCRIFFGSSRHLVFVVFF